MSCHHNCDCDECLNRGGGTKLHGAGKVYRTEAAGTPSWRISKLDGDGTALMEESNRWSYISKARARARERAR